MKTTVLLTLITLTEIYLCHTLWSMFLWGGYAFYKIEQD